MKNLVPAVIAAVISFTITVLALKYNDGELDSLFSSSSSSSQTSNNTPEEEVIAANFVGDYSDEIQENFADWNAYHKSNIDLMSTYIPFDQKAQEIDKGMFLTLLRTGAYIATTVDNDKGKTYQLVKVADNVDAKVVKEIKSLATTAHAYYKMEGKRLPSYDFVGIDGKSYNKADTEGKLLVLKCWFITCKVCVEEFPQLNMLVDEYKDKDIAFVSLAFDEGDKLKTFLETKEFKYATIPLQKDYMAKKLKVKQYPTHLIVDQDGKIIKMVNNVATLAAELELILNEES